MLGGCDPSATCTAGREAYSAAWVGLGGYGERASALEQIGTDADCARSGSASYSTWYELLPAGPVDVRLKVHPGDELTASVTVRRNDVTLRLRDLTTGARFSVTKHASRVDTSSAEWIVEAPSACVNSSSCRVLTLADFGEVAFLNATATARGRTGPVGGDAWSAGALELQQSPSAALGGRTSGRLAPPATLVLAAPSALSSTSAAFSVAWSEQAVQPEQPSAPTLSGSGGGPP